MELVFEGLEFVREDGKVFSLEDLFQLHADQPEVTELLMKMQNEIDELKSKLSEGK